ncbi:hypothetical protein CW304_14760 [Bacillus sp. UFRGS-B20]|nr:hypothetical protein CW304_14760 [Bacillus sp. UFRGS-B20]
MDPMLRNRKGIVPIFILFNQLFHPYVRPFYLRSECIVLALQYSYSQGTVSWRNLAVLTRLIGSPYEINTDNTLLLLEEHWWKNVRIDRIVNQLTFSGKFNECRDVIFKSVTTCILQSTSQSLQTILI